MGPNGRKALYTYEVADDADREATRAAARALAQSLLPALDALKN